MRSITSSTRPIVALDIDGTIANYHVWFLRFAELYFGRTMPDPAENTQGVPLYKWMGVSKASYRQCKLAYRQGGMKRSMPCYPGSREMTVAVRKAGAEVWICTTRPYLRLDNIDPDTRHFLRRNRIQYDAVLWGEHKYRDLVKAVGRERVVAVLDDLPEMRKQAVSLGLNCYLRDQPYNRNAEGPRVLDLWDARDNILADLEDWKKTNA